MTKDLVLVTGGGGFIGGHLVATSCSAACASARSTSSRSTSGTRSSTDAENLRPRPVGPRRLQAGRGRRGRVYNLAADMGGMGFIENNKALCMLSVLINTHLLMAARDADVERFFYSSSACVYAADKQTAPDVTALAEADAYPAMPEDGYGWEKLFSERMCRHFREDFGLETRVARYHNVYGPHGTYDGGREKAPAAICRKVAEAKLSGTHEIEIWGDGEQTRSFMYIDDCVHGIPAADRRATSTEPINLGSAELVTINQLVDIVEDIAGIDARAALQARRAAGRARPQQRQHADPRAARLGAVDQSARRPGADLPLDLRPDGRVRPLRHGRCLRSALTLAVLTKPRVALSRSAGGSGYTGRSETSP